jgi:hypothetical protein
MKAGVGELDEDMAYRDVRETLENEMRAAKSTDINNYSMRPE